MDEGTQAMRLLVEPLSKRALKRVQDEMRHPYEGILYEGINTPRKDQWVRLRRSDMVKVLHMAGIAVEAKLSRRERNR